jgi:response regulator RpfG family c-di-GMP phosphodiesterase
MRRKKGAMLMERAVLMIDDEADVLRGLARVLRHQPYRIYTATSAEEAMLLVKGRKIDVVVADEHMPGMRGGELLAWIAEHCPEVVRIVLTGHPTIDTAIRAINEGRVYQFFTKPCDPVHLGVAIRKAMENKDVVEHNRRLMDGNRRQAEEIEHCRSDLMILKRIVAPGVSIPLQPTSCLRRPAEAREGLVSADSDAAEVVERVFASLSRVEHILDDLRSPYESQP